MNRAKGYSQYRQVSAQTFSSIPSHWEVVRGRHLVRIRTGSGDTVDADPDGAYPFYVRSDDALRSGRWEFDTTAVLTAGDGAGVAKVFHLVTGRFMAHQRVYVLDDFRRVTSKYFYYAFSNCFHLVALDGSAKSTVDSVRRAMIADLPIAVPPPEEQRAITHFLDREAAKIDTLIEEQKRLVETLRERRQSVVDRGIFGLDSPGHRELHVIGDHRAVEPLLSNVPQHWAIQRFKSVAERLGSRNTDLSQPMMSLKSTGEVVLRASLGSRQEPDKASLPKYLLTRVGDLVVNPMWLIGGAIGVSQVAGAVSPDYRVFDVSSAYHPRYLHHLVRSRPYVDQYLLYTRAQTTFDRRVQQPDLDNLPMPVPPLTEQILIADHIDDQVAKIDALLSATERFIELSGERRSALITAAVTGQIDVRGLVA